MSDRTLLLVLGVHFRIPAVSDVTKWGLLRYSEIGLRVDPFELDQLLIRYSAMVYRMLMLLLVPLGISLWSPPTRQLRRQLLQNFAALPDLAESNLLLNNHVEEIH